MHFPKQFLDILDSYISIEFLKLSKMKHTLSLRQSVQELSQEIVMELVLYLLYTNNRQLKNNTTVKH